jgi:hypothetical protein
MSKECFVRDEFQKLTCLEKMGLINLPPDRGGHNVKAWVWSRLITGIAGSNPAEGMDVRLVCLL